LYVRESILQSIRSVILSQCKEWREWVIWKDLGALTMTQARECTEEDKTHTHRAKNVARLFRRWPFYRHHEIRWHFPDFLQYSIQVAVTVTHIEFNSMTNRHVWCN